MTTSSASPGPWEVWLAYLRFAGHPQVGKVRPVIVLGGGAAAVVAAKVTTAEPREAFSYCELLDWDREGLLKPSRAQVFPLFTLAETDLLNGSPLGVLSERDRAAMNRALAKAANPDA